MKKRLVRPPFEYDISDTTWETAREWLHGCTANHRFCRTALSGVSIDDPDQKPPLPTRVIYVPAEGEPRLFESNGQSAQYLALSYCWGKVKNLKLTKETLAEFKERLPIDRVPRTIRDAIEVARQLEVEYLWIDSICIIQDDDEDWEREAKCMASIYSNALCTVAALGGETSESGLFTRSSPGPSVMIPWYSGKTKSRKYHGHFDIVQTLPFRVSIIAARPTAGFRTIPRTDYPTMGLRQEMEESNWNTRGWVVQERTLSRRILYFGKYQVYWECQMAAHSEDGVDRLINDHVPHEKKQQFRQLRHIDNPSSGLVTEAGVEKVDQYDSKGLPSMIRRGPPKTRDDRITDHMLRLAADWGNSSIVCRTPSPLMWALKSLKLGPGTFVSGFLDHGKLIRNYSRCELSESHDKLPAFQGLGEAIAKRTGQRYVAGIWTGTLARGLFWYPLQSQERSCEPSRAPSWSWASWNGPVVSFAEDRGEIKDNDSDNMKDPEIWMQGGWSGFLKDESFPDSNMLMERELDAILAKRESNSGKKPRGYKPVSMRATALFVDVDQDVRSCVGYNKLWTQLTGLLRIWPGGYSPWPQDQCHLLFMRPQDYKGKAKMDQPKEPYKCPKCHAMQESRSERSLLKHVKKCKRKSAAVINQTNQTDKLIGIAQFDNPGLPPKSFRAIVLWNNSDRSVFHGEDLYHPEQGDTSDNDRKFGINLTSMWGYEEKEMNPLHYSDSTVLGLERCRGPPKTKQPLIPGLSFEVEIGGGWYAKAFPRRKRNYFLLLVEPTEWESHYRRVGIAIAYWIPGIQRFGGVKLSTVANSEKVVLL